MENREFGKEPNGIGQFHLPLWLRMKRKIEDYKLEGKAKQKIPQMLELLQHPWESQSHIIFRASPFFPRVTCRCNHCLGLVLLFPKPCSFLSSFFTQIIL